MSTNNPMSNIPPLGPPTGMMPGGTSSKFKPIDPLRVLRANWLWIIVALILGTILGGGTWFGVNKYATRYTSDAQFKVQATNISILTGRSTGPVRMDELEPLILSEVQALIAEPILRTILNQPAVQNTKWFAQFDNNIDGALENLTEKVLGASHVRNTQLFRARASTRHEEDAQIILTALQQEYMRQKEVEVGFESTRDMLAAQSRRNAAEERLTGISGTIKRFLTSTPLEALDERSSEAALQVNRLVVEVNELEQSNNSLQATAGLLQERLDAGEFGPSDEERQFIENSQEIIALDGQLRQLRVARAVNLKKFKEEHEVIKQFDTQILEVEREREAEFENQALTLFNAKYEQAQKGLTILVEELAKATTSLTEWKIKRQDFVRQKQQYDTHIREQEQAEIERELAQKAIQDLIMDDNTKARVTVLESYAPQKAKKTWPPEPYITIPVVAFFFTGFVTGLIFLRELLDQRVRSAADVKMIPDASLVGMIPSAGEDRGGGRTIERVVEQQPAGLLAEAFRQVRTSVLSKMDRRGYKTLMLVSAKPSAGVTTIAQNLGASCALSGRRVLIIDANFRRPGMADLMGISSQPGLADVLCGDQDIDAITTLAQDTNTQGLSLLPVGNTANAAVELFENPRFRELMARLESEYDLLIIDAPPALLTSDAQLLSRHMDAMLLVSRAQSDTRGMLQRVYRELDGQRADILGIVLNGVQASAGGYLKRNFREFHAYSGPDRRKSTRPSATPPAPRPEGNRIAAETDGRPAPAEQSMSMTIEPEVELDADDDEDIFDSFDLDGDGEEK